MTEYLSEAQLNALVETIGEAEAHSTGEIRIHIDSQEGPEDVKRAWDVFQSLEMSRTAERNGVLFHINFMHRYLTIIGDEGIHRVVSQSFWDELHDKTTAAFAAGKYFEGLKDAILQTGLELKKYFPTGIHNPNELSNDITFS